MRTLLATFFAVLTVVAVFMTLAIAVGAAQLIYPA